MTMPGFTAEASLNANARSYVTSAFPQSAAGRGTVVPQFCYCSCQLRRFCFLAPPGVPICYWINYCVPHGNCPPGYCGGVG